MAFLRDGSVWPALAVACCLGVVCLALGILISRRTGLLGPDAPSGETLGIGLSVGLIAFVSSWASIASAGASMFGPVAVAMVAAVTAGTGIPRLGLPGIRGWAQGGAAALILVAFAILYGTTVSPSPRDGIQPLEFSDGAYYAVLSADLAESGRESIYSPAGFADIPGLPKQTWYHWGEIWMGAAVLDVTGISPLHARYLVVLPLLLLAVGATAGALMRTLSDRHTTEFFLIGAAAMLFIAPVPVWSGGHFDSWARGLAFNITLYGLAAVVALLGLYVIAVRRHTEQSWSSALMVGAIAGAQIATHIGIAAVAATGILAMASLLAVRAPRSDRLRIGDWKRWRTPVSVVVTTLLTIVWGFVTGHGLGATGTIAGVGPFDPAWLRAVVLLPLGAGVLLAGPVGWVLVRRKHPVLSALIIGASAATLGSAVVWGARVADFNMFHLFYGAVAVFLTPVSIAAAMIAIDRARQRRYLGFATIGLIILLVQTAIGFGTVGFHLYTFGPGRHAAVPLPVLDAIRALPDGSKLAYACDPYEVFAFWDPSLVAIDAHTGARMVPMCFQADRQRGLLGRDLDPSIPSTFFERAPQRKLYPQAGAKPTSSEVRRFLLAHGINFIYADAAHPNSLVENAEVVYSNADVRIHRVSD